MILLTKPSAYFMLQFNFCTRNSPPIRANLVDYDYDYDAAKYFFQHEYGFLS